MSTPNNTDQYTRFMVGMFDEREVQSSPQAFQAFFGQNAPSRTIFEPDAGTVEIDILRANGESLASLVNRGQASADISRGKNTTDQTFTNFVRKWPLIEEESNISSDQLLKRLAGDSSFSGRTRLDKNRIIAMDLHNDQIRKATRTMEFLAMTSILTGQMPAILSTANTDLIYDFKRLATHTWAVGNKWDVANGTALDDIDASCELIEKDSYMTPNFIGIGDDAMAAFIADSEQQDLADNRRYDLLEISTANPVPAEFARFVKAGWIARGRLRTPRGRVLWIFNNNQRYTNAGGTSTRYMPSDKAFVLDINARMDRYFGPRDSFDPTSDQAAWGQEMFGFNINAAPMPQNVTAGGIIEPRMFYFDHYRGKGNKVVTLRAQAAPIFATTQTDAIVVMTTLV